MSALPGPPALPGYRDVHLRLFARAPAGRRAEIARDLASALGGFGVATVHDRGPYWKEPGLLEFTADLEPAGQVAGCVQELIAGSGRAWDVDRAGPDDGFYDVTWAGDPGCVLLHPAVEWAHLVSCQAPRPPRYRHGEIVRMRADGRSLWVRGRWPDQDGWWYTLQLLDEDIDPGAFMPHIVEQAVEDALEPTGRSVPAPES